MRRIELIIILILVLLAGFQALAEDAGLKLMDQCEVAADDIFLKDLVQPAGKAGLSDDAGNIRIAAAPVYGKSLTLSGASVASNLKIYPSVPKDIQVPEVIKVERTAQTIEAKQIEQKVKDYLARSNTWPQLRQEVEIVGNIKSVEVRPGRLTWRIKSANNKDLVGRISVLVEIFSDNNRQARLWVPTRIHVYAKAYQTKNSLRKSRTVSEQDLEAVEIDLLGSSRDILFTKNEIVGLRTKMSIARGKVITRRMVELPPVVKRGDVVTIILASGPLSIKAMGEVRIDGFADEKVTVLNLQTQRIVYARVIDKNTVQVDF